MEMEKLSIRIKKFWIAVSILVGLILGSVASVLLSNFSTPVAAIVGVLVFLFFPVYAVLRYRNWGFEMRDDHFYLEHGVFRKVYSMVPHVRIQHIDTNRGPVERILGLSSLIIYTAGSKGADVKIPGLERERAERMQERLREVAVESEKGFDAV